MPFFKLLLSHSFFFLCMSCSKFLDAGRANEDLTVTEVFNNDSLANAVALKIYADMSKSIDYPNGYLTRYMGLYSDELQRFGNAALEPDASYFKSDVLPSDRIVLSLWSQPYSFIYQCNSLLENIGNSSGLSDTMRSKLKGEAYFLRALHYFYLVNLFGGVPLITNTSASENQSKKRESKEVIWQFIIDDLRQAENLLPVYTPKGEASLLTGIRASKWAARALLARAYLYDKDWQNAVLYSSKVIDGGNYQLEADLSNVFLINSREVIFQIEPARQGSNTAEANYFLPSGITPPLLILRSGIVNSFEGSDLRKSTWLGIFTSNNIQYYYPNKWKVRNSATSKEYNVAFRFAEQYLIRAEALAQLGQLYGAKSAATDLSVIRSRAGLQSIPSGLPKQQVLMRIEQERFVELFSEWGHRWFDLRRTAGLNDINKSRAEEVIGKIKANYNQNKLVLPVPESERILNSNLGQNAGY